MTESVIPLITEKLKQYRTRDHIKAIKEKKGERPNSLQVNILYSVFLQPYRMTSCHYQSQNAVFL